MSVKELSGNTKFGLSIATVAMIVSAAGGAVWKAQQTLLAIQHSVQQVSDRITSLEATTTEKMRTLEAVMADRFTKTAAAEWALRIKVSNPTLRIPDPREPARLIGEP